MEGTKLHSTILLLLCLVLGLFSVVLLILPKEGRRQFMMMASEFGMTDGDYVFYTIEMLPEENVLNPEDVWASNDGQDAIAKKAFEAVFHVRHGFCERKVMFVHETAVF